MHKLIGFNIKRNKKLLVSDIVKFFEVRGYDLIDADARGMLFKRGSLWGNMTSMNPSNWFTKVDIEIIKKEKLNYNVYANYHFLTSGFFRTKNEDEYYNEELNAFSKAIEKFEVDAETIEYLAQSTNKSNLSLMLQSLFYGIITSILLVFLTNSILSHRLPISVAFTISLVSIVFFYWGLSKLNKKV